MKERLLVSAAALLLVVPIASAQDGAALYKSKCAGCHGASGEGKPVMAAPAINRTAMNEEQIALHITKGETRSKAPHNKGISGVSEKDAKAIADYVTTMHH